MDDELEIDHSHFQNKTQDRYQRLYNSQTWRTRSKSHQGALGLWFRWHETTWVEGLRTVMADSEVGSIFEPLQRAVTKPTAPTPWQTLGNQHKSRKSDRDWKETREMWGTISIKKTMTHQIEPKRVGNQTKSKTVK
jgi:hypothetical protein